ncbi:MAG: methyltransferase domain-containing protein, partial [Candidatus Dadabacteria bacterium]
MKGRLDWIESVKEYYGKVLSTKSDLQTDVCCAGESPPPHIKEALSLVHEEVKEKFYGCGSPIPLCLDGIVALDLGCGTGRDCFILSKLVGEKGKVIGVDMTEEQLEVARRYVPYHTEAFGYSEPNITFINGYIEDLKGCGLEDSTVDLVISNCVINLSPDKERVFSEIFRVLKPGGELYFSDIFALQRIPENLRRDPLLVGECIGGAMYIEDFRRLLLKVGCADFR